MTTNKTEQSNKKQIRNFLICAWNGLKKPASNYTKKMCPQAEWEQDKLAEAVKRMLKSRGLEAVDSEIDADLIVLVPRHSDLPYQIADARIFHRMLCGSRKHVLLIDRLGILSVSPEIWPKWFYCIKNSFFKFSEFTEWIKSARLTQGKRSFRSLDYSNLGCELLAGNKHEFPKLLDNAKSKKLSRSGTCLLLSYKLSQFFYGLLRMSCRYDRLEHDMNRDISDVFTFEPKLFHRINMQKKILDFCVDLKRALRVTLNEKTKNANGAENNGKLILVIDDQPDLIKDQIEKIQEIFFPDFTIYFWQPKPAQEKDELCLSDIEKYNSLAKSELVLNKTMPSWPKKKEQSGHLSLKTVLSYTRFALVDILFPDDKGKDKPKGIAVIRGLQRLAVDLPKKEAAKGSTQEQDAELFDIVALSRADDMDKIQPALQAGACGYVLKSRPLALPGVLGELETSIREPITKLHRNFRSLYNLPNETIKLLQTATISPKLSFHVSTQGNKQGKKTKNRKSQIQAVLPMANLLATIPKADLHIHVGSCMSPEFLAAASFVMLIRHRFLDQKEFTEFQDSITGLIKFWSERQEKFEFCKELCLDDEFCTNWSTRILRFDNTNDGITNFARLVRKHFKEQIRSYLRIRNDQDKKTTVTKWYEKFRSILHQSLDIPDHLDEQNVLKKMSEKPDAAMFQFAMTHSGPDGKPILHDKDDLLRIFVLFLAAGNKDNTLTIPLSGDAQKVRLWFTQFPNIEFDDWKKLHKYFWEDNVREHNLSPGKFREYNWKLRRITNENKIEVNLNRGNADEICLHLQNCPDFEHDPISYLLATGTRCTNLRTYLEGCEFSGAEHLRHPYLIHLYAQQTVHQFVTQGVMYAELRAAVSGYKYKDFTFQDGCDCMRQAFQQAQRTVLKRYQDVDDSGLATDKPIWLWKSPFAIESLFQNLHSDMAVWQFPVKVSLILTGKRHKSTRQMLQEAASATVLHSLPQSSVETARQFVAKDMEKCRLVGFDLAGQEDDDHAPHLFRSEFEQISKMHIPITVHAGENAPAGFVESAVLDLRARRIGHGLALIEDKQLMNRLREDGVCVELCPVSNFQTNQFVPADDKSLGREYPLRAFLKNGNAVCLNTDNPIISYTNMVKECFQASYAFGGDGLSLWELLRILRMGFVHSFLSLPERRSMLELADQILFDLFSDPGVVENLRCMAACRDEKKGTEK